MGTLANSEDQDWNATECVILSGSALFAGTEVLNLESLVPQELKVWSLYHFYIPKTKSSQCHYVMTS